MNKSYVVNGVPDKKQRRCCDCKYLQGYLSAWCVNEDAVQKRKTHMPGISNCPFWEPMLTKEEVIDLENGHRAKWSRRLFGDFISSDWTAVDLSKKNEFLYKEIILIMKQRI